jgi:methylglutaconyl-CoA hydratase
MSHGLEVGVSACGIATVLLNRPERSNAIDQAMLDGLAQHFAALAADARARVIVLRGAGRHFCSGADVAARASAGETPAAQATMPEMLAALDRLPLPTLAVVQGAAIGAGAGLAACCDIVLAADNAFFSIPEVRLGMAPFGLAPFLIRAMGLRAFRRYGLSGERIGAAEALRIGLAHEVAGADAIERRVDEITDALLHGAPGAMRELKTAVHDRFAPSPAEAAGRRAPAHLSAEAREGIASFKEKRKPSWYPQ